MMVDPTEPSARALLEQYLSQALDGDVQLIDLPRSLKGGCENRNYRLTVSVSGVHRGLVLRLPLIEIPPWRRVEDGYPGFIYDLRREYRVLQELRAFKVSSPQVYGLDAEGTFFGAPCFLMEMLPGEHLLRQVFPQDDPLVVTDQRAVMRDYAHTIARIARMPFQQSAWLQDNLQRWTFEKNQRLLEWNLRAQAHEPLVAWTLAWLAERQPAAGGLLVNHGDPNPSNFLSDDRGIISIIDWENLCLVEHPLWCLDIFYGGYFGALLNAGLAEEFCECMSLKTNELEWFVVRGMLRDSFADSGRQWAVRKHWQTSLGRAVRYAAAP
jgi:aminoglycoside phosphotransferase (APT) family kinase protein